MLQATGEGFQYLVVPLPPCGPPLLGCMVAWTLVLVPSFFFSPFAWVLSIYFFSPFFGCFLFMKFDRVSLQWAFPDYISIFKIFEFVEHFLFVIVKSNDKKESSIMTCPFIMYWSLARRLG
jgi:hypothetical protein